MRSFGCMEVGIFDEKHRFIFIWITARCVVRTLLRQSRGIHDIQRRANCISYVQSEFCHDFYYSAVIHFLRVPASIGRPVSYLRNSIDTNTGKCYSETNKGAVLYDRLF